MRQPPWPSTRGTAFPPRWREPRRAGRDVRVLGTQDLVIPIATQRSMAERAGATISEVEASHVSMISRPEVTLAAIRAAVDAIG